MVQCSGWGLSDVGRRRSNNQDTFLVDNTLGLYVVADGMGGHSSGEVASREAVDALHGMVKREADTLRRLDGLATSVLTPGQSLPPLLQRAQRVLESAIQAATYMVYALGQAQPERRGMGTTISALLIRGHFAISGQVGDSRIYLIRDQEVSQITEDHTLIAWQLKKGLISPEQARYSPKKNVITRAVGARDYVQVDMVARPIRSGDRLLLCSDGLYNHLQDGELAHFGAAATPEAAATAAVALANDRGGVDNITAVFVALH